jgi:glycosyltransferase involved in cell wall biosynthesis
MPYQIVDGASGFLVDPLDARDIAARLTTLLTDPLLRQRFGTLGRQIARARFHPAAVARRTAELYAHAIGSGAYRDRGDLLEDLVRQ